MSDDQSKDRFFERLGRLAEKMIAGHGKDFAMGTLVLAARFIAEGKPLVRSTDNTAVRSTDDTAVRNTDQVLPS